MDNCHADITTVEDIKSVIDQFYTKVTADPLLAPVFSHVDLPKHLPTMYDFWSSLLFGTQEYRGNPFQKHVSLPITGAHFEQWLFLFKQTIDENFSGDKADEMKLRAHGIAGVFQSRLGLLRN